MKGAYISAGPKGRVAFAKEEYRLLPTWERKYMGFLSGPAELEATISSSINCLKGIVPDDAMSRRLTVRVSVGDNPATVTLE